LHQDRWGGTPAMSLSDSFGAANSPVSPAGILSFTNRSAIGTLDASAAGHYPASPIPPGGAATPLAHQSAFDAIDANHDGQITREEFEQAMKGMASSVPAMTIPATSTGMVVHRSMPAMTMPATVAALPTYAPASDRTEHPGCSGSISQVVEAKVLSTSIAGPNIVSASMPPPPPATVSTSVNLVQSNLVQQSVIGTSQGLANAACASGVLVSGAVSPPAISATPPQVISARSVTATPGDTLTVAPLHSSRIVTTSAAPAAMVQSCSAHIVSPAPPITTSFPAVPVTSPRVSQLSSPLNAGMRMTATPPGVSMQASQSWKTQGASSMPAEDDAWFAVGSPSVRVEPAWRDGRWWLSAAVDFRGLEKLPLGSKQAILCVADEALEQMECQGSMPQLPAPSCWDDRGCPIS